MFRSRFILIAIFSMVLLPGMVSKYTANAELTDEEYMEHALNSIIFPEPCETGSSDSSTLSGEITIAGSTAEDKLWSGLKSFLSDEQAAGIMGNVGEEDGNYNPVRREVGQSGRLYDRNVQMGMGFIQWSFGRRVDLLNYVKEQEPSLIKYFEDDSLAQISGDEFIEKVGEKDANRIFQLEVEFIKKEMDESYQEYYNKTDIDDATVWARVHYERPGTFSDEFRKKKAHEAFDKLVGKSITPTSTGTGGSPSCNACEKGSLNINGAAVCLAWPLGTDESKTLWPDGDGTDLFNEFWAQEEGVVKGNGTGDCWDKGAYCCGFSAAAVRYSGYDPNFESACSVGDHLGGGANQYLYVVNHPDLWELIPWNGDKSKVQGGDVIYYSGPGIGHSYVIVQDESGEVYDAEASMCGFFGRIGEFGAPPSSAQAFIFRAKNARNSSVGISVTDEVKPSSITGEIENGANSGNKDIGASAIELAWPYSDFTGEMNYKKRANDKFTSFYETLSGRDGDANGEGGKSCDYFVHTVLVYTGLEENDSLPWGHVGKLNDYFEQSSNWEEVKMTDNRKLDEYKSGDIVIYFKGDSAAHIAIVVEIDGKKYTAQASHGDYYGVIKGTGNITGKKGPGDDDFDSVRVFRNKKEKSGEECDICGDGSDGGQLKAGGFDTVEEATKFMQSYIDAASPNGKYYNYKSDVKFGVKNGQIHDAGCPFGVLHNCVAFSQWFVNNYTTVGPDWNNTTNGVDLVGALEQKGLKRGTEPRPYAIFSKNGPSSDGHTGVILGVNTAAKKVIVGDAACNQTSGQFYKPRAYELTFSEIKDWWYAYTDDKLSMGGPLKNA